MVEKYEDLYNLVICSKRGAVYFDKFDKDEKLNKIESYDDANLSKMFIVERFDTMIVLDKLSIELAFI